jgi:hypothetical protein
VLLVQDVDDVQRTAVRLTMLVLWKLPYRLGRVRRAPWSRPVAAMSSS